MFGKNGPESYQAKNGLRDYVDCGSCLCVPEAPFWSRDLVVKFKLSTTWRIIPFSKWLVTMVSRFPK